MRSPDRSTRPHDAIRPGSVAALVAVTVALTAATSSSAVIAKDPPPVLTDVESSAEDLVDYALARDRPEVVAEARALTATVNGPAASALRKTGVPDGEVLLLEERATRVGKMSSHGAFVAVALAANGVSELMPSLYRHYRNAVPPLVLRLDYLDREAQLRSLARQPRNVTAAVEGLGNTWPHLRPRVIAAGGTDEAKAYDRHVVAMERLRPGDRRAVQAEAVRGLELVDELERVFTH